MIISTPFVLSRFLLTPLFSCNKKKAGLSISPAIHLIKSEIMENLLSEATLLTKREIFACCALQGIIASVTDESCLSIRHKLRRRVRCQGKIIVE